MICAINVVLIESNGEIFILNLLESQLRAQHASIKLHLLGQFKIGMQRIPFACWRKTRKNRD